ncbi:uncharacterized protein A1O5_09603, partial [Cladophialophora psammophila CBS 110553]
MCHYERTDFQCGDFRWGNMKDRCDRQKRIGETCPATLLDHNNLTKVIGYCKVCQQIAVKRRKLQREENNIRRWHSEGNKLPLMMDKAVKTTEKLREEIIKLHNKRTSVQLSPKAGY